MPDALLAGLDGIGRFAGEFKFSMGRTEDAALDAGVEVSGWTGGAECCVCCVGCTGCICWKNDEGPGVSFSTPGMEEGIGDDDGVDEDAGNAGVDAGPGATGRTTTSRPRTRKGGRHAKSDSTSSYYDCGFFKPIAIRVRLVTTAPLSLRSG